MKQVKIVLFAALAMMTVGFTSCIKGEDPIPQGGGLVTVDSYLGSTSFREVSGIQAYPTPGSLLNVETLMNFKTSSTKTAFIVYEYQMEGNENMATTGKIKNVNMKYAVSLDSRVEIVSSKDAPNDSVSTAPIMSLNNTMVNGSDDKFSIWNNRFLVTGIQYFYAAQEHYFTLVYNTEEQEEGKIKLRLRHSGTPEKESVTTTSWDAYSAGYPFRYLRTFDLNLLPGDFGSKDVTIEVVADVNTYNNKLKDETNTKEKTYSVFYKAPNGDIL